MNRRIIAALDTADVAEAVGHVRRLAPFVGAFKIGHALTLSRGLDVVTELQDAGAKRIFLDLKFHDIPSVVGLAVREATRRGVWMLTMHVAGGRAMMQAAVEEAAVVPEHERPCLLGVTVLTSLDEHALREDLGVGRSVSDHMLAMSRLAIDNELDGLVCSPREISLLRGTLGSGPLLVVPGIRPAGAATGDQARTGDPLQAQHDGASYLVMGRALVGHPDPESVVRATLAEA